MSARRVQKAARRVLTTWSHKYLGRGSGSNLQPLFASLLNEIVVQIPNSGAALYLREKGHLILVVTSDELKPLRYRRNLPLTGLRMLLEREVTRPPSLSAQDFFTTGNHEHLIAFSLRVGKAPKGLLLLRGADNQRITARKMAQVRPMLVNLATTLSMVNALVRERERSTRLGLINRLCQQVDSMVGESNLYDRIVSLIQKAFAYDHVGLYLVDKKNSTLILQSLAGKYRGITPSGQRIPFGQ